MPIVSRETYIAINACCDVMLDSLHWSGGNTSLDAFAAALPVVTLPGRLMRGRQTLAMLRAMGLDDRLAALNEHDYVRRAVEIATDQALAHDVRESIVARRSVLFGDRRPLEAMQSHYMSVLDVAR
jgi:predicted O-linked N-acetylglucosamine transferase (SPINDLY family)